MGETLPPLVAIKEANSHLQLLHDRNQQLEKDVIELRTIVALKLEQEQCAIIDKAQQQQQDLKKTKQLEAVIEQKDMVIEERDNLIVYLRSEIENLNRQIAEKNKLEQLCDKLKKRCSILDEIVAYKECLDKVNNFLGGIEIDCSQSTDDNDSSVIYPNSTPSPQSQPITLLDENSN